MTKQMYYNDFINDKVEQLAWIGSTLYFKAKGKYYVLRGVSIDNFRHRPDVSSPLTEDGYFSKILCKIELDANIDYSLMEKLYEVKPKDILAIILQEMNSDELLKALYRQK